MRGTSPASNAPLPDREVARVHAKIPPRRGGAVAEAAAWAGCVREFLSREPRRLLGALSSHHRESIGLAPAGSQHDAWRQEIEIVASALPACCTARPSAQDWGVVFEFELPLEGGRRPDVVVLAGGSVIVLEFESGATIQRGDVDQVAAYTFRGRSRSPRELA